MNMQITGGSASVRFTGTTAMQTAGAAARELLINAAAKTWDVPANTLRAEKSMIYHDGSGRSAPFAEFSVVAAEMKPNLQPKLKSRKDYRLMGKSLPRVDIPEKIDGRTKFAMDAEIPNVKYATVMASPVHGEMVAAIDDGDAGSLPGVQGIYNMGSYVAVVADGYWQAKQALDMLDVTFTASAGRAMSQEDLFTQYAKDLDKAKRKTLHKAGNVEKAREGAISVYAAEYTVPFLAHACMEPMNAAAWVRDGKCDLWVGTQNPLGTRAATAKLLGFEMDAVTVHTHPMGGAFGRRAMTDFSDQAVEISRKSGLPIKLIWSREETTQQDYYRPAAVGRFKAALDSDRMPISWESVFVHKLDPAEACQIPYNIPNQSMQFVESPSHVRLGPWRSVDHTQHGFFTESFIEELAQNAGQDGYQFRRKLLAGRPRFIAVLDAAAELGKWDEPLPASQAKGIAIVKSFMTIAAQVVTVDMTGDTPRVVHVACAADPGLAVNPDGFTAQMESGILYGLTAAMYGEITLSDGAVEQSNFHDYEMVRMDTAPVIDTVIINSDAPIGGGGEPGTPPIAPAFANAIFNATGKRVRTLPIKNIDFGVAS